ncbi:hypothetical protein BJ508DRAFT_301856 [Ascobolus immersus RN42]|uniref:Protein kinase domain-containing protein n=1 Tax=Ascobolus immersus RN42 TaxID=1160509 RepID=A0A3N4IXV3_ASCIM|nr:hypothetical protein BJ508DRAFT_301856 [Ascobolus immersus RN42]
MEFGDMGSMWGAEQQKISALNPDSSSFSFYGGHGSGLHNPSVAHTQQREPFWDESTIHQTITSDYIRRQFSDRSELRGKLDAPLDPGDDLSDSTYCEWIRDHAARFFIVLLGLGVKEKIFDVVEASWDDGDLPLSETTVARLGLGAATEKRFLKKQYEVLVKVLERGDHVDYYGDECVPVEPMDRKQDAANLNIKTAPQIDKVSCRKHRERMFLRKRVPLSKLDRTTSQNSEVSSMHSGVPSIAESTFAAELEFFKSLSHKHIQTVFASYTQLNYGYVLFTPAADQTLRQFISNTPLAFKSLDKPVRRGTILKWMHCLASALNYLHSRDIPYHALSPRSIYVTNNFDVVLSDIQLTSHSASLLPKQGDDRSALNDLEGYEYGAPELWVRRMTTQEVVRDSSVTFSAGRLHRAESNATSSPTSSSPPMQISNWQTVASMSTIKKPAIFSLGAIYIDMFTFILKRKLTAFSAHRSSKNRRPRMSSKPDASFHSNIEAVQSWVDQLDKDARKKKWSAGSEALDVCRAMIAADPHERISGQVVLQQVQRILELETIKICDCHKDICADDELSFDFARKLTIPSHPELRYGSFSNESFSTSDNSSTVYSNRSLGGSRSNWGDDTDRLSHVSNGNLKEISESIGWIDATSPTTKSVKSVRASHSSRFLRRQFSSSRIQSAV